MRLARALSLLVPLALLAPATPVAAAAPAVAATKLTISDRPDPAVFHDDIGPKTADVVRHRGRLTTAAGDPVAGAIVHLEQKLPGEEWVRFKFPDDETTDDQGVYTFLTYVEGNAQYRVAYDGDGEHAPADSVVEPLKAMRDFNARLVEKEHAAILKGDLNPGWNNRAVQWEKRTCTACSWKTIDQEKSGDTGTWSFVGKYPPKIGQQWYYRAVIDGGDGFVKSYSSRLITTRTPSDRGRVAVRR